MPALLLAALLVALSAIVANAQTPGPTMNLTVNMSTTLSGTTPTNQSATVTATASDTAGLKSIVITNNGVQIASCSVSPCSVVAAWPVTSVTGAPHTITAVGTMTTSGEIVTNQIQYPY